jgi:hypothetical protein
MEKRVVEVRDGGNCGGGFGVLGVIIGALLVVGVIFFFAGGMDRIAGNGGGSSGPSVTVNTGSSAPSAPSAPSRPAAPSTTTGSTPSR